MSKHLEEIKIVGTAGLRVSPANSRINSYFAIYNFKGLEFTRNNLLSKYIFYQPYQMAAQKKVSGWKVTYLPI